MRKRNLLPLLLLSFLSFGVGGCTNTNDTVDSKSEETQSLIKISDSSLYLSEEKTFQLSVEVDESLKNNVVFWMSRNPDIASVSSNGLVTANKEGNTIISVQVGTYVARCAVNVLPYEPDSYLSVNLENSNINLNVDDEYHVVLDVRYGYEKVEDYTLVGDVNDSSIASFEDGKIGAKAKGQTDIILTITYNSISINELIYVNVF